MATWGAFTKGQVTQAQAAESVLNLAGEMANIFKGKNPRYVRAELRSMGRLEGKIVAWVRSIRGDGIPSWTTSSPLPTTS